MDLQEIRQINKDLEAIGKDIAQIKSLLDEQERGISLEGETFKSPESDEGKTATSEARFTPLKTYSMAAQRNENAEDDVYSSLEYRNAFKNYVLKGTSIPSEFLQKRSGELTTIGDIGAIIPTTIQNKVISDFKSAGNLLARVTQTFYPAGVRIPISDINFKATWLDSEYVTSDEQKANLDSSVMFGNHVLEAKVGVGLLTATVALPIFETIIQTQLTKSMTRAIEDAIVNGSGVGQPLGFTKYNLPADQIITMTEASIGTVKGWASVEAVIPEEEENNLVYLMSKGTWEKYLNGMTSTTGQKIGLGKINERGQKILNGREVFTLNKFPSFDNAAEGAIWGVAIDLSKYLLNTNLAMYYKKYFNEDTNKWIHKTLTIVDGRFAAGEAGTGSDKRLVGAEGLIYLKK